MNNKNDYKTTKLPQQGSIFFDDDEFEPVQQAKPAEKPTTASGDEEWRMHFASFGSGSSGEITNDIVYRRPSAGL